MLNFKSILELLDFFKTEADCINFLKQRRCEEGLECHYCGSSKVYLPEKDTRFRCINCKNKFSVRVGTIFSGSNIPLRKWFIAMYLLTAHKRGISSCQLAKDAGVTQKSAWFMLQRMRFAMMCKQKGEVFVGVCEADETHIGSKEGNRHMKDRIKGTKEKTIVVGVVNRNTKKAKAVKVASTKYQDVGQVVMDSVKDGSILITDESTTYKTLEMFYERKTVNHSIGEYVNKNDKNITTNTVEGLFSLIKRTINGTYFWVSKKHIDKYLAEIIFRYNTREVKEFARLDIFLNCINKRLRYKNLIV